MDTNTNNGDASAESNVVVVKAKPVRRVYKGAARTIHKVPQSIFDDPQINEAIAVLPPNYNFEIHKTIWRAREMKAKRIALQMPEGACPVNKNQFLFELINLFIKFVSISRSFDVFAGHL